MRSNGTRSIIAFGIVIFVMCSIFSIFAPFTIPGSGPGSYDAQLRSILCEEMIDDPQYLSKKSRSTSIEYTPFEPIRISGNDNFTKKNGVVSGNGTRTNPYLITGWDINATMMPDCIRIEHTTAYFVIRDCNLYDPECQELSSHEYYKGAGIFLNNVKNGTITNCHWNNCGYSVFLNWSDNNMISNNKLISNESKELRLLHSNNNIIQDNEINGEFIKILYSDKNIIDSNFQVKNSTFQADIGFYYSNENLVTNNIRFGIIFGFSSENNMFYENQLENKGFKFSFSTSSFYNQIIAPNNTMNGRPIYYYGKGDMNNQAVPTDAGQVIVGDVTNLRIENLSISGVKDAITMHSATDVYIANNTCTYNQQYGIYIDSCYNIKLENNNCSNNKKSGIKVWFGRNNVLNNNTCLSNHWHGIELSGSEENLIANNKCRLNYWGIHVTHNSNRNIIKENTCMNNNISLLLSNSSFNWIYQNIFTYNNIGIELNTNSNDNSIIYNHITNNNGFAIFMQVKTTKGPNKNNIAHHNNFIDNYHGQIQVHDDTPGNKWDADIGEGNYWSDYKTRNPVASNDGYVWDTPIELKGRAEARDNYPLVKQVDINDWVSDFDMDNDGYLDVVEIECGTDPFNKNSHPTVPEWGPEWIISFMGGDATGFKLDLSENIIDEDTSINNIKFFIISYTPSDLNPIIENSILIAHIQNSSVSTICVRASDGLHTVDNNITIHNENPRFSSDDVDFDNDKLPTWWEEKYGLDPWDPFDAGGDFDGDGHSNLAEFLAETDPNDVESKPEIQKNSNKTDNAFFIPIILVIIVLSIFIIILVYIFVRYSANKP